jgi:CHAD domain-containing protein
MTTRPLETKEQIAEAIEQLTLKLGTDASGALPTSARGLCIAILALRNAAEALEYAYRKMYPDNVAGFEAARDALTKLGERTTAEKLAADARKRGGS